MGQALRRLTEIFEHGKRQEHKGHLDLSLLPPELGVLILSYLDATDVYLAASVWSKLAHDNVLWRKLCLDHWHYASVYDDIHTAIQERVSTGQDVQQIISVISYERLFLQLDEASVTFNADPETGVRYLIERKLVRDDPSEIAKFIHGSRRLHSRQVRLYLENHSDVLSKLMELQNYQNQFLPLALRRLFKTLQVPNTQNSYLRSLLETFSRRFCECNPKLGFNSDMVYILCFSLIMLSVDLNSPHIKNKMSKREFIRNLRQALQVVDDEFFGHCYDDVYVQGHVAPNSDD